jgi:hypothetical protein
MYQPLNKQSGAEAAGEEASRVVMAVDGVTFAQVTETDALVGGGVVIPERLRAWLRDLHLLRHIPISYLVPDQRLLPPESIRFFHVDPTWIDRVIDGALAAANTGTVDSTFGLRFLLAVRQAIDADLVELAKDAPGSAGWNLTVGPLTGMLMRSEAVRRWPDMVVNAVGIYDSIYDNQGPTERPLAALRAEPISKDIYIALFAGEPVRVELHEPKVGLRYGVESQNPLQPGPPYQVNQRSRNGAQVKNNNNELQEFPIERRGSSRVINIAELHDRIGHLWAADEPPGSCGVALHLEQRPYKQIFDIRVPELLGAQDISPTNTQLRHGRRMNLDGLKARLGQ